MYTKFPPRLARFAFLLGLVAVAVCAIVVFPLQWLSLKAEASATEVSGAYSIRAGEDSEDVTPSSEPTPAPSPTPAPPTDRQIAGQAGMKTLKIMTPVFVFLGGALVCFLIEIATGPRSGA